MNHDLTYKSHRDLIAELVHRYADAVGRRNGDDWIATWAPDARWILAADRDVTGHEAILQTWLTAMQRYRVVIQRVLNGEVQFSGNTATGRWHIQEHFRKSTGEPGILLAHYDDTYVHVGNDWLFASRSLERYYVGPPDLSAPFQHEAEV
jgi:ketosteroid isomerase-like protein